MDGRDWTTGGITVVSWGLHYQEAGVMGRAGYQTWTLWCRTWYLNGHLYCYPKCPTLQSEFLILQYLQALCRIPGWFRTLLVMSGLWVIPLCNLLLKTYFQLSIFFLLLGELQNITVGNSVVMIKSVYDQPIGNIVLSWERMGAFPLRWGARQEYPLLPLLFNMGLGSLGQSN